MKLKSIRLVGLVKVMGKQVLTRIITRITLFYITFFWGEILYNHNCTIVTLRLKYGYCDQTLRKCEFRRKLKHTMEVTGLFFQNMFCR